MNQVIIDTKNCGFDGNLAPFCRYERELLYEAGKIAREEPNEALADGVTELNKDSWID